MTNITINIEGTNGDYQGWFEFDDSLFAFMCDTKLEMLNQAKELIEDYLEHEGKDLKITPRDLYYTFKFI
ncbi:MAG: hypothetical protein RL308_1354 [Bacteroidota bacterium]|jgi:hypothetical protein